MMEKSLIAGFDHAMIAVRDLDEASRKYRGLGFEVVPGGRHPGRGTHNTLMRFGWGFVELIAIHDPEERERLGAEGEGLTNFLKLREGGWVDVILETHATDQLAERLKAAGVEVGTPFPLGRVRPDGLVTKNRILPTGPISTRHLYPGIIEWEQPDPERLAPERQIAHANGATEVVAVAIIVDDLNAARRAYAEVLGLPVDDEQFVAELGARRVRCMAGSLTIDLLAATGPGVVESALTAIGEGLFEVRLRVKDLAHARAMLAEREAVLQPAPGAPGGWLLPEESTVGARFVLVEQWKMK
ncbi:MAG: VOC family protein [Blastocatellia bacterium]